MRKHMAMEFLLNSSWILLKDQKSIDFFILLNFSGRNLVMSVRLLFYVFVSLQKSI